jgi:hypothetical protein
MVAARLGGNGRIVAVTPPPSPPSPPSPASAGGVEESVTAPSAGSEGTGPKKAKNSTAAARAKRYRDRKKAAAVTPLAGASQASRGPAEAATGVTPSKPTPSSKASRPSPAPSRSPIHRATFVAALALAVVSGGYSIFGLASIFTGAVVPVVGMGIALEVGKLSAVAWFSSGRGGRMLRMALFVLVGVLMCLNTIGAYGFLAKAHLAQSLNGELAVMGHSAEVAARLDAQRQTIADLDTRIGQIDAAVAAATKHGRTSSAMELASAQRKNRDALTGPGERLWRCRLKPQALRVSARLPPLTWDR